ncbi:MAG: LVIVD repeat-containing protein [Candidatus Dormibacteria bacterium]
MGRAPGLARIAAALTLVSMVGIGPIQAVSAAPRATTAAGYNTGLARARAQLPMLQQMGTHGMMATRAGDVTASQAAPAGATSSNIKFLSNLPIASAISLAFIGKTVFVSTVVGLYSVDISDPTNPQLLGSIPMYIWENEHMTADPSRNLVFIARDPRGFTTPATTAFPYGATHIIDVSNPRVMTEIGAPHLQPTGHTATCINDCKFLWIAGPASPAIAVQSGADPSWGGRPMWGLDITDPSHPMDCPHFIDLNNHDGKTDYDHDVDVDASGIAWISGSGHVRGYWTSGQHLNPTDGKVETATGCQPIPAGGGNTIEGQLVNGGVIHNSFRNFNLAVDGRRGDVLAATEEVTMTDCAVSGRFVTYDLAGSMQGQDWTNPPSKPYVLPRLGVWTPQGQPGSTGCDSSHWFTDRGDGLVAIAFYTQGTRILDTRDPRHVRQLGYYNVQGLGGASTNNAWAAYWHGDNYIYVADFQRGLDVLRYSGDPAAASGGPASAAHPVTAAGQAGQRVSTLPDTAAAMPWRGAVPGGVVLVGLVVAAARLSRRRRSEPGQ